jgi:hypothetical protein
MNAHSSCRLPAFAWVSAQCTPHQTGKPLLCPPTPREGEGECVYETEGGTCEGLLHGIGVSEGATRVSFKMSVMPLEEREDWADRLVAVWERMPCQQ